MRTREKQITRVTLIGSIVNLMLTAIKIIAGVVGKSGAMIADGIHSLSDLASDIVVLIFVPIAGKAKDKDHKYGHGKFETLATLVVSLILMFVAIRLVASSGKSIISALSGNILPKPGYIALVAAIISIVSKEILYQYTALVARRTNSSVCKANAWHHRSDALSSIGSLLGIGGAVILGNKWTILDPVAAVIIGLMILFVAIKMAKAPIEELMEKSLDEETEKMITDIILATEGVQNMHNLKTRRNGQSKIIDCHIRVKRTISIVEAHDIATNVEKNLKQKFGNETQTSIHIEPEKEPQS